MDDKSKPIIVALKLAEGNLLGFYLGESDASDSTERGMNLYRAIFIESSTRYVNNTPIYSYDTRSYFEYGSQQVVIPYSKILHYDMASDFFALFYVKNVGELMETQERVNDAYMKYYNNIMIEDAMKDTDSIFVDSDTEFMH